MSSRLHRTLEKSNTKSASIKKTEHSTLGNRRQVSVTGGKTVDARDHSFATRPPG